MIVNKGTNYIGLSYQAWQLGNAASAAYWLYAQHRPDTIGIEPNNKIIIEAFTEIAALLGYRVEKIEGGEGK